jgi:hypothetical protein
MLDADTVSHRTEAPMMTIAMRRILLCALGAVFVPVALSHAQQATPSRLTFQGDTALWTVAIKPEKTADFEQVMARLHEALLKSALPSRQEQARGWKVVRLSTPLPDGTVGYLHVVHPVVPDADYTVMQILYDELPDERQALYELYRGAFAKNVSLATGTIVEDMSTKNVGPATVAAR